MEENFWHERWAKNEIGFHEGEANALLVAHFKALSLAQEARIFVPLCGKTRDIAWLLSQGHKVAGAELSETAVEQLFEELGLVPTIGPAGKMLRVSAENVVVYQGNIFDLTAEMLGPVDAVYDRAALVALPDDLRSRYAAHVRNITGGARQLVICFEYEQSVQPGPPFSISAAELSRLHGGHYAMTELSRVAVKGGLKGLCPADEAVWLLKDPKQP